MIGYIYYINYFIKIIINTKYFDFDILIKFFKKVISAQVHLLLYYDGIIENDEDGIYYSQSATRMARLSSSLSRQELLDHLYSDILIDQKNMKSN